MPYSTLVGENDGYVGGWPDDYQPPPHVWFGDPTQAWVNVEGNLITYSDAPSTTRGAMIVIDPIGLPDDNMSITIELIHASGPAWVKVWRASDTNDKNSRVWMRPWKGDVIALGGSTADILINQNLSVGQHTINFGPAGIDPIILMLGVEAPSSFQQPSWPSAEWGEIIVIPEISSLAYSFILLSIVGIFIFRRKQFQKNEQA